MNKQTNNDTKTSIETGSTLDYLRMDNEVSMEVASVLSTGAWVERDDTGLECSQYNTPRCRLIQGLPNESAGVSFDY